MLLSGYAEGSTVLNGQFCLQSAFICPLNRHASPPLATPAAHRSRFSLFSVVLIFVSRSENHEIVFVRLLSRQYHSEGLYVNLCSMHGWAGIVVVTLFYANYVGGFFNFFVGCTPQSVRLFFCLR